MRAIALIDGEHHPGVSRAALDRVALEHELVAVLLVGGEEKVPQEVLSSPAAHFGRHVAVAGGSPGSALRELAQGAGAETVIDLCGEPVLAGDDRMLLASVALDTGLEYRAPGMELSPPPFEPLAFDGPVLAVIGTGKRTGKTAIAGHWAALLKAGGTEPVIVAMGRGGPPQPQLVRSGEQPDLDRLLEIARAGAHAASDYLEDAVLAGVTCVGCRRCGEGPAGEPFDSNVAEGARLAASLQPDAIVLEGSGAAFPPVEADRTICVTSASLARRQALSHLGPYRLLRSQLVTVVGADELEVEEWEQLQHDLAAHSEGARVIGCRLDPEPAQPLRAGARAAVFVTARPDSEPSIRARLAEQGVDVAVFSANLARRAALAHDVQRAASEGCDLFLTELKAAAIDVVAEAALRLDVPLIFLRNRPRAIDGGPDLDEELLRLAQEARGARAPVSGNVVGM